MVKRSPRGWAEDVAWSRDLPIEFGGIPGKYNHLSDFLSHLADVIAVMAREDK